MEASTVNNLLPRLQRWYLSQCNGDWEHSWGVKIETLDNPGWMLSVNLEETNLDGRTFTAIERGLGKERSNQDWMSCSVAGNEFKGACGPEKLAEVIAPILGVLHNTKFWV